MAEAETTQQRYTAHPAALPMGQQPVVQEGYDQKEGDSLCVNETDLDSIGGSFS